MAERSKKAQKEEPEEVEEVPTEPSDNPSHTSKERPADAGVVEQETPGR